MLESSSNRQILSLSPSFAKVLSACRKVGELFVIARSESCVVGAVMEPLHYFESESDRLAWGGELTINFSRRSRPVVLAYKDLHEGRAARGIEFFDRHGRGCLKVCSTEDTDAGAWADWIAPLTECEISDDALRSLRQTCHLHAGICCEDCRQRYQRRLLCCEPVSVVRERVEAFIQDSQTRQERLDVYAPCKLLRARLTFQPGSITWRGSWLFLSASDSGCHLQILEGSSAVVRTKAGRIRVMDVFDFAGRFVVRFTARPKL